MRADFILFALTICIISITALSGPEFWAAAQEDKSEKADPRQGSQKVEEESQQKRLEKIKEKLAKFEERREQVTQKAIEKAQKVREEQADLKEEIKKLQPSSRQMSSQKVEEVRERLFEKIDKLNQKTVSILEKIRNEQYLGIKRGMDPSINFTLSFTDIQAKVIGNSTDATSLTGVLNMTTFDVGKKNLKFEVTACDVTVDNIRYLCGFGKARTISSGDAGAKDSLVIIAFLEDSVLNQLHSTLKIFLESDQSIIETENNSVSILGPQSVIAHQWFLNGTANLSKIAGEVNELNLEEIKKQRLQKESTGRNLTIKLSESVGISAKP